MSTTGARFMTTAEKWIQRGRAKGDAKGRAVILRKLVQVRFGELPEVAASRIDAAVQRGDGAMIQHWVERVLAGDELASMFED
jgi:hypothetical protein